MNTIRALHQFYSHPQMKAMKISFHDEFNKQSTSHGKEQD